MDESKIALVKTTWAMVEPIADEAATLFYERLFLVDPSLRDLFPTEMAEQRAKLMKTIGVAVKALDRIETIVPVVRELGRRHLDYRVEEKDYDTVGAALLWTLGAGLGPAFTDEARAAWGETYGLLAETMKAGARETVEA